MPPSLGLPRRSSYPFREALCGSPFRPPTHTLSSRMATTSVAHALVIQVDAVLYLIETLSPSLSANDIIAIRQALALAYDGAGVVLERRNLETEGVTLAGEFHGYSLGPPPAQLLLLQLIRAYLLLEGVTTTPNHPRGDR